MHYIIEVTENEALMLEENGTVKIRSGASGSADKIRVGNSDEPWMLLRSVLLDRSSDGDS